MSTLKTAIKTLINSGIIVEQDAFEFLKTVDNPIDIVNSFLQTYKNNDNFSKKLALKLAKQKNHRPTKSVGKIKRRHSRIYKANSIDERINNSIPTKTSEKLHYNGGTILSHKTVIRTNYEDLSGLPDFEPEFEITYNPNLIHDFKGSINNLIQLFQSRFTKLARMFSGRSDIKNLVKLEDLRYQRDKDEISVIGMISSKYFKPDGGGSLEIENPNSNTLVRVILPRNNNLLLSKSVQLMTDTVVCVIGFYNKGNIIASDIILPDIPNIRKKNRAEIPVHAAFLSDIHIGSKNFLDAPFDKFIKFLNGEHTNKKIAAIGEHTKYLLFGGDVVDGVGIYPNQLDDLRIDDISEQYNIFAGFLERVPSDVNIVIIPGNHDMVRAAEPQPSILPQQAPEIAKLKNVHLLPNPSQVSLHNVEVLLYHCTSLPDIMNHVPGVPTDQPVEVMKHMLKARHLAPIWGAKTPIAAEAEDYLVINKIPDIFHGGHIHINGEGSYKGIQIINSGTMQNQTSFQRSLNIIPTPGQITVTNLKSFQVNRINFFKD